MTPVVVETPVGPGHLYRHPARRAFARLLLSHGAGNGSDTVDVLAIAEYLPRHGVGVARFDQPWKVAGRKVATPPATLDVGLRAAVAAYDRSTRSRSPLFVGGRSAGARSACRCAAELGAVGVVAVSFPLHPPGRPERSRLVELEGAGVPVLVVQGERDPMGRPEEFPESVRCEGPGSLDALHVVPAADHGLKIPRSAPVPAGTAYRVMAERVLAWVEEVLVGNQTRG